ncbi:MAG: hypothetical protein SGPRY_008544, partial [Prymnesium sp.]
SNEIPAALTLSLQALAPRTSAQGKGDARPCLPVDPSPPTRASSGALIAQSSHRILPTSWRSLSGLFSSPPITLLLSTSAFFSVAIRTLSLKRSFPFATSQFVFPTTPPAILAMHEVVSISTINGSCVFAISLLVSLSSPSALSAFSHIPNLLLKGDFPFATSQLVFSKRAPALSTSRGLVDAMLEAWGAEGEMGLELSSLCRLVWRAAERGGRLIWPTHGLGVALTPPSAAAQPEVKRLTHVLHERAANEGEVASSTIDQSSLYEVGMPPCLLIPFHLFTSLDRSSRDL